MGQNIKDIFVASLFKQNTYKQWFFKIIRIQYTVVSIKHRLGGIPNIILIIYRILAEVGKIEKVTFVYASIMGVIINKSNNRDACGKQDLAEMAKLKVMPKFKSI